MTTRKSISTTLAAAAMAATAYTTDAEAAGPCMTGGILKGAQTDCNAAWGNNHRELDACREANSKRLADLVETAKTTHPGWVVRERVDGSRPIKLCLEQK